MMEYPLRQGPLSSQFSQLSFMQYMGLCVLSLSISLVFPSNPTFKTMYGMITLLLFRNMFSMYIFINKWFCRKWWVFVKILMMPHFHMFFYFPLTYFIQHILSQNSSKQGIFCMLFKITPIQISHIIQYQYLYCVYRNCWLINTLRQRQMDAISQKTFSNAFSWIKMFEFQLKFHWSLFPRVQLTIFQQWFR